MKQGETFRPKKPEAPFWLNEVMDKNTHNKTITKQQPLKPEWIRVTDAVRVSGISRSKIYELIKAGKIKSFSKRERGGVRGMRLIFFDSLLDHIEEMYAVAMANHEGSSNANGKGGSRE